MLRLDAPRPVSFCDGFSRRDFLHAGALSALGLTLPGFLAQKAAGAVTDTDVNCIMLFLVGGPSQIDTWDPKPNAPDEVRGPFKPIDTNVPGMRITEIFPQMARHADKFSLVRSVYHTATAVHDTGHQMMQTGRLFTGGVEHPHVGCVLGYLKGGRGEMPAHVLLPKPIGRTGGNLPHGQTAGYLGKQLRPVRAQRRPQRQEFQGARSAAAGLHLGRARRSPSADARRRRGRIGRLRGPGPGQADGRQFPPGLSSDVQRPGPRGVRAGQGAGRGARPLRPDALRPGLPAGAPADRARRALRDGQHVRDGLRRDHLGHPRLARRSPTSWR